MKKKIILYFFTLLNLFCFAQVSQNEYFQIIDYVNCKYTEKYTDLKRSELSNTSKEYLKDIDKYKKAFNNNVSAISDIYKGFDKTQRNSTSIYEAFRKSANRW